MVFYSHNFQEQQNGQIPSLATRAQTNLPMLYVLPDLALPASMAKVEKDQ
jgi:hypothetical protein